MRTVHCSGRLSGGGLSRGVYLGGEGVCLGGCLPRGGSAWRVYTLREQNDRQL